MEDHPRDISEELDQRIRALVPFNRLPAPQQDTLVSQAEVRAHNTGEVIFTEGEKDAYAHYLLEGTVSLWWHGKLVRSIHAEQEAAALPLDTPGPKRHTMRARSRARILRIRREALERQLQLANTAAPTETPQVQDIEAEEASDWIVRILQSGVFASLPAGNIQRILSRMEETPVRAGQAVVRQGERGEHYYIIEEGTAEVRRTISEGRAVHLADLGPGEAFGEEALIANAPRNATVTMRSDGRLKRLHRDDFNELILRSLLHPLSRAQVERGAAWIDVRSPEEYAVDSFKDALNVPLTVLRVQCRRLDRDRPYVVCSDDPNQSAVGAFLLAERGFDVSYLGEAMHESEGEGGPAHPGREGAEPSNVVAFASKTSADSTMNQPDDREGKHAAPAGERPPDASGEGAEEPVPPDLYADTFTGQKLAELIDQIHEEHRELKRSTSEAEPADTDAGQAAAEAEPDISPEESSLGRHLESLVREAGAERPESPAPAEQAKPQAKPTPAAESGDELNQILAELETRLRRWAESATAAERARFQEQLQARVANIKRAAEHQMRRNAEKIRQSLQAEQKKKEQRLQKRYEHLMTLANRISRQKAEIQQARKQIDEKLKAADALHREVTQLGENMSRQIGDLEGLMAEGDDTDNP